MKVLVRITQEILERSKMCGTEEGTNGNKIAINCAVALAVRDILPYSATKSFYIDVMSKELFQRITDVMDSKLDDFIIPFKEVTMIALPEGARDFITEFDMATPEERIAMEPFSFVIDIPDSIIDIIGIDEAKTILEKSETLELV